MQFLIKGFTLLELLFTLLIFTLLTLLSVGDFSALFARHAAHNETHRLFHTLQFARTEAIKRNQMIGLCGSEDFHSCHANWSKGYMVFILDQEGFPLSQNKVLRIVQNPASAIHSGKLKMIKYSADGRCLSRGSLYLDSNGNNSQKIVIYDSGRARIEPHV